MDGIFTNSENKRSKHKSVEWYTPKWVFDCLGINFDLDPSSPHDHETFVPAKTKYTIFDDGLSKSWAGTVWLNPPYGASTPVWMRRFIDHGNGISLVFSRTDTSWCQDVMQCCDAMLFVRGRINFEPGHENKHKRSRCGAGTVMFAFGDRCVDALSNMADKGVFIRSKNTDLQ